MDVLVWNGKEFDTVSPKKADDLVKKGTHQIATGVCSNKLMSAEDFAANKKTARKKKQTYKTREMRADNGSDGQPALTPGLPGV